MTDGLFYLEDSGLVPMRVTPYDAETVLQELIEKHPDLLAGGADVAGNPRRWLLVKREHPIPDGPQAGARFSVDHFFVDQDAVPTLVEVKRSSDTRIRREVVGQMLDYAANGVRYWPAASLQAAFVATQEAVGADPAASVAELRQDPDCTVDSFFAEVETNLHAGRLRLVFVADVVPDELRRIVEFLNEQMSQTDVFAVEVKQYLADGRNDRVIVPTLIGRTGTASAKDTRTGARLSRDQAIAASTDDTRRWWNWSALSPKTTASRLAKRRQGSFWRLTLKSGWRRSTSLTTLSSSTSKNCAIGAGRSRPTAPSASCRRSPTNGSQASTRTCRPRTSSRTGPRSVSRCLKWPSST